MKKVHYLWYLLWLLPAALLGLGIQQTLVYYGLQNTLANGQEYQAEVIDVQLKHMSAQSNGMIVLRFHPDGREPVVRKLSVPLQNAGKLMESETLGIRYLSGSYQPVVILSTIWFHTRMVLVNIGVIFLSFLITAPASFLAHRYAERLRKKIIQVEPEFEISRS
ncbi:MAG: hypothetical protein WD266_09945 [Balneolales bacterium]